MQHIYMINFYSVIKNKIVAFAGKQMEMENIVPSEISQAQKAKGQNVFSHVQKLEQSEGKAGIGKEMP